MIIQMQAGIGKDHQRTKQVIQKAEHYGLKAEVVESQGTNFSVVEVKLIDTEKAKASKLPEFIFTTMDGVSDVRRVTPSRVSLAANGEHHSVTIGSEMIGRGHPCHLVAGSCTVDGSTPKLVQELSKMGVKLVRGGCFKPRSRPGSYTGPGTQGLRILLEAAGEYGIQGVFTEVLDTSHIAQVDSVVEQVGYKGKVVLWVGARTTNQELMLALGRQGRYPVMVKNGLRDQTVDEWMDRVSWLLVGDEEWDITGQLISEKSLSQGNEQIFLCVRGLANPDKHSRLRGAPNLHWIGDVRKRFWPPIGVDTNHFTGTMQDDLVLKYLRGALIMEDPDFVLLECKLDGTTPLCDAEQAVPLSRVPEALQMILVHGSLHHGTRGSKLF